MGNNIGPSAKAFLHPTSDSENIACGGVGTFYSRSMSLEYGLYFAIGWKAVSDGNVVLKVEYEMSHVLPVTEGAADSNFITPDGASDIDTSLTDENMHRAALTPASFKYMRLKITGSGANDASTVLNAHLSRVERY